jgi:hypothetical protein
MNNSTTAPVYTTSTPTPTPSAPVHDYLCADCTVDTIAVEVHAIGGGDVVAYCGRCADVYRRYAVQTYSAPLAHMMGIRTTL